MKDFNKMIRRVPFSSLLLLTYLSLCVNECHCVSLRSARETSSSSTSPDIGAYRKNFKGVTVEVISETKNSDVHIPFLDAEHNLYFGKTIQLNCNSSVPVQWVYEGTGAPAVHTETFRVAANVNDTSTYSYRATVVFTHTDDKQSGMYTCQGILQPELKSYFYVFVPGNKTSFLLDNDVPKVIHVNSNVASETWINLPCTVSNATAKVQLYKYLSESNETLEHLEPNENLTFDPRKGFNIRAKQAQAQDILGKYVCSTENEHQPEKLTIIVEKFQEQDKDNELPTGTYPLEVVYDENHHQILCCNKKTGTTPEIKSTSCDSISDCNIKTPYLRGKKCPGTCEQHVVPVNSSCVAYELSETRDAGIMECYYEDYAVFHQFSKEVDVIITEFQSLPPLEDILTLMAEDIPASQIKEGEKPKDRYVCHANTFFFSTGLIIAGEKSDGTMEYFKNNFPQSNTIEIEKSQNFTKLHCYAPIWNSANEWKSVSINVT